MNNKRELKRYISDICTGLFSDCVAAALYDNNHHPENVDALLALIMNTYNDFVCRVSHPEPGMKPKVYYKILIDDFNVQISEILDQISNQG